jgi:hypothetical protein
VTTAERLLLRLRAEGLRLPEGARLRRVYPSASMRNLGAWSWCAVGPDGEELRIGSRHPMGELLHVPALVFVQDGSGSRREPDILVTYVGGEA